MSFKQKSSPLQQSVSSLFSSMGSAVQNMRNQVQVPKPMTAAEIAYSNTPAGQRVANNTATPPIAPTTVQSVGQPVGQPITNAVNRGRNLGGNTPTNTVNGGPQSVQQRNTSGWRRTDSHNTNVFDRTNGGSMFNGTIDPTITNRSNMFSPFPQLKKEQMEYNKISPKAFSNAGTIGKMMGQSIPNSPFMQMVDPLTGLTIDPTMSQDPNAPVPPPMGVQVPTTPTYDINQ